MNAPIQGTASDIMKISMIKLEEKKTALGPNIYANLLFQSTERKIFGRILTYICNHFE